MPSFSLYEDASLNPTMLLCVYVWGAHDRLLRTKGPLLLEDLLLFLLQLLVDDSALAWLVTVRSCLGIRQSSLQSYLGAYSPAM